MPRLPGYTKQLSPSKLIGRVDLHYQSGNSDKVYILEIAQDPTTNDFYLMAFHGRNGSTLRGTHYGTFSNFDAVKAKLRTIERSKLQKGYQLINDEGLNGNNPASSFQTSQGNSNLSTSAFLRSRMKTINFTHLDDSEFRSRFVVSDDFILHRIPHIRLVYAAANSAGWTIFDAYDSRNMFRHWSHMVGRIPKDHDGLIWFGMFNDQDTQFIILDVVYHPQIQNIYKSEWKDRRMIMNVIYDQLFPGVDPYDTSNTMYFAEYYYDDKIVEFTVSRGIWIARNIKHPFKAEFFVTTK